MKLSRMRKKARAAFKRWTSLWFRTADGMLHSTRPGPVLDDTVVPFTEVVVIRDRVFTRPEAAKIRWGSSTAGWYGGARG